jgi:hypothetical protein
MLGAITFINGTWQLQLSMLGVSIYVYFHYPINFPGHPHIENWCKTASHYQIATHTYLAVGLLMLKIRKFQSELVKNLIGLSGMILMLFSQLSSADCFY